MPLMGRENKMKTSILLNKGRCAALQLRMETMKVPVLQNSTVNCPNKLHYT
jgi:hypothetical protein